MSLIRLQAGCSATVDGQKPSAVAREGLTATKTLEAQTAIRRLLWPSMPAGGTLFVDVLLAFLLARLWAQPTSTVAR